MKKLLLLIVFFGIFLALLKIVPIVKNGAKAPDTSRNIPKITVKQKITGQDDFSSYQIEEDKTALDLLKQSSSPVTVGEKENAYVAGINGIKAEAEKQEFWAFYVNDKMSSVGAGSYKLKNGDKIEWKVENY
ncbi:hypothetical protein A2774_03260 [Candidatus Roizmanbacteria bacterium RIFCSPHIGHO2_01_FULL_39_12c]|uniref:Transcobalamin-like C-terminal domain-containing protein n=1 Tax=Candidatus Roizmanbacteria bacterium RIFCSPHIGHO2_01_FULL_39_12c TaxID=1802031 RepID=A0A1F7GCP4_9BACT|nr:MAG: hypothetical protein A2774_03260 [Candidatus Roizmanbacteria bacterium RIFCSPHIGHO2_01_FULL_39_12c]OGK46482.1 MAG: hypothetical protein A2963_01800 [Candidatus Roizmanbacteria bacterium RIFCSPLOWO2_01_FULL_40_13]